MAGRRLRKRVQKARSTWVVATVASHGYAATLARRGYACWIGTSLDDEWSGRRCGLGRARRAALAASAPALLRLERRVLRGASRVYATSPHSRETVAAAGGRTDVGILPIPVDVASLVPVPDDRWRKALARPTLVFVGRGDDPRKNAGLLLDGFVRLRERIPEVRLRLVGRPPAEPLPEGVESIAHVMVIGDALRDASLLVVPSRQEGFGIVAAEALACGIPVLSTPCGGPESLLRTSGGGRVLCGFDPEELASTAAELLEDTATLSAMRRQGRAYVLREHSPSRFLALLEAAFEDIDRINA
jgi:glycosyltransferase involved in cell wall biosynthesis